MSRIIIAYKKKLGKLESPANINVNDFKKLVPVNHAESRVIPWRIYKEELYHEDELKKTMKFHERNASVSLLVVFVSPQDTETKALLDRLYKATIIDIIHIA